MVAFGGAANGAVHHNGVLKGLPDENVVGADVLLDEGENLPAGLAGPGVDVPAWWRGIKAAAGQG